MIEWQHQLQFFKNLKKKKLVPPSFSDTIGNLSQRSFRERDSIGFLEKIRILILWSKLYGNHWSKSRNTRTLSTKEDTFQSEPTVK